MKKQTITIEREVPDEVVDSASATALEEALYDYFNGAWGGSRVSVVSEPIPEPIVLKVTYSPMGNCNLDADTLRAIAQDAQRILNQSHILGSFHVEVIPQ